MRFNRLKYSATLAAFARTARDETDLAHLVNELERITTETMQPQAASLWLRGKN